jgi:hypothetical protein
MSFNIFQAIPIKPLITSEMISHPLHPNLDPVIALDFRELSAVANRRLLRCDNFILDEMIGPSRDHLTFPPSKMGFADCFEYARTCY